MIDRRAAADSSLPGLALPSLAYVAGLSGLCLSALAVVEAAVLAVVEAAVEAAVEAVVEAAASAALPPVR